MTSARYTFEGEIGRGASGAVHLGRDTLLGRDVALKRVGYVPGGSSPEEVRAEREARIAASLSHPHLVGVFDLVHVGDSFWLVMEYVQGASLGDLVKQEGAIDPERATKIVADLAAALAFVHANGIVHRDVKPSNVLVADPGAPGESAKLTDFGIARGEEDHALTQTGLVTGSPAYLSPEVVTGGRATEASDVWALGATLFHMLAGQPPYDTSENVLSTMYRIVNEPPPRLVTDPLLARVLEMTLVVDPAERWSAEQVRNHLIGTPARGGFSGAAATPRKQASVAPPEDTSGGRYGASRPDERPLWQWVALAAVITAITVLAFVLGLSGDDKEESGARAELTSTVATPRSSPSDSPHSSQRPTDAATPSPTASPSEDRSTTVMTDAALESFGREYLAAAPADPSSTWGWLTASFQNAAGGVDGYSGWWTSVQQADVLSIAGDASGEQVTYQVRYTLKNGRTSTEWVTLQMVERDGALLIDGES